MAVLLAACGGGKAVAPAGDERPALTQAVRAYSDAYLGGRADIAHGLLTERCQERVTLPMLVTATAEAKRLYGGAHMTMLDVDQIEGSLARVTYRYDVPAIDQQSEPWAKENGHWRQDDC